MATLTGERNRVVFFRAIRKILEIARLKRLVMMEIGTEVSRTRGADFDLRYLRGGRRFESGDECESRLLRWKVVKLNGGRSERRKNWNVD